MRLILESLRITVRYGWLCVTKPADVQVLWWAQQMASHCTLMGDIDRAAIWWGRVHFHRRRLGLEK